MSRGLRSVFAVLFLAAAVSASAGPDDLFDARAEGALQLGQQEFLLALEQGRYTLRDGRLLDARAPDRSRPFLTKARVAELLALPSGGAARPEGPSSSAAGDAAYQRALSRVPKGTPADLNFDGGSVRSGGVRGPPENGRAPAATDPAVLQSQLLLRLNFTGNKAERVAYGEAVALILKSKTGREFAEKFVRERATADVNIKEIDNAGETDLSVEPPVVTLSKAYLKNDKNHSRVLMAGTLAHELFGHAYEVQRAKKAKFSETAHYHYRGDEVGARLIDWLVQTELTGTVADEDPQVYLDNPEAYHRSLLTRDPYYITTLSPLQMKDPATALRGRRKRVADDEAKTASDVKDMMEWTPILEHFIGALHRVAKARLAPAEKELDDYLKWAAGRQKKLAACKEALERKLELWSSREGAPERAELRTAADSAYMKTLEAEVAGRAAALRKLRAAPRRGPSSVLEMPPLVITAAAPAGPPIDLEELGRMNADDLERNPGHKR